MATGNKYDTSAGGGQPILEESLQSFLDLIPHSTRKMTLPDEFEGVLLRAIATGPAPPSLLLRLAREADFTSLPIIEAAVRISGGREGLFDSPRGIVPIDRSDETDGEVRIPVEGDSSVGPVEALDGILLRVQDALGDRRQEQAEMARSVMTALAQDEISIVEAGTGTGKSLAYLLPAAVFASHTGERVVISTHTRHLQQQLLEKELPVLQRIIKFELPVARLLGRENYICSRKLVSRIVGISADDPQTALRLGLSAAFASEGTAESIPVAVLPFHAGSICAPPRCMMKACPQASVCPLLSARKKGAEAAILIVNHALLMTDHRQGGSVLGPYSNVIFDEAHHLERCVTENLSIRVSEKSLERIFDQVIPVSTSSEWWKRLTLELESGSNKRELAAMVDLLALKKAGLESAYSSIFKSAASMYRDAVNGSRTRYVGSYFLEAKVVFDHFYLELKEIQELLKHFYEVSAPQSAVTMQKELRFVDEELTGLAESVRYLQEAEDPDGVFWLERRRGGRIAAICGSPLEIDRRFADYLEERTSSAVFTSATLAGRGKFDYFEERLGIRLTGKEPVGLIAGSPFDFAGNLLILRTGHPVDPNEERFSEHVADMIDGLSVSTGRRIMALFTSYRMCLATATALERMDLDGTLLVQGDGGSRESLSSRFRETPGAILLGVASFWEGVDFPGGELEILVIPKLPFPVPTEPVIEARSERMELEGGNPFINLFLPEAILRLRQGVGRLIRRKDDRGVAVLMDPRLGSKSYAETVISSLPVEPRLVSSAEEAALAASAWFE